MTTLWIFLFASLLGSPLWAGVERADKLYAQRGENIEKARQAAAMYGELAATTADNLARAEIINKQAQALYYIADQLEKKKKGNGKSAFEECYTVANTVVESFAEPKNMKEEEQKAAGLFWYGACLGKAKRMTGLSKVKKAMNEIIDLGYDRLYHYAVYRTLGRINYLAPWPIGKKKLSKEYHKKSFENTLISDRIKISVHGMNNLFYADILSHKSFKEIDLACEILQTFVQQDPKTLLEDRIPETIDEMEMAKEKIKSLKCPAERSQ